MAEDEDFKLFKYFLGHLITGGLMFLAAGAVSIALELAADYIEHFPALWVVALVFHAIAYLILVLDVSCLVFFLVIRAYRFVRDTWNSRGK
jgi:hypothetical protein